MPLAIPLAEAGRLPMPGDNCAIALRRLEAGSEIEADGARFDLDATVLEGHRFAVETVTAGGRLLSWGLPFGRALKDIRPGTYVCNASMLETLLLRKLDLALPSEPNFEDDSLPPDLSPDRFKAGSQVARDTEERTFLAFPREGGRGAGTRNYLVVLGVSSRTSSFARLLARRVKEELPGGNSFDGVAVISHTEGGGPEKPNNLEFVLRVLAGFMVHPNVGAVLAVDEGREAVTGAMLRRWLEEHGYPLDSVLHRFQSLGGNLEADLRRGEEILRGWVGPLRRIQRVPVPLSRLKVALQCGGSDAFSGISANPLVAWVAREILRYGGTANLAETDELIGAESYVLQNVKDYETARSFLEAVERFKERVAWHGHTAEGNPSGGNRYRGLYNIALKSIGAALKRHPEVRLDEVIEYGERMSNPGFHFMDSPGNDLESVAGQVASGANLIFFTTGNGSITNFPFVPTLKVTTTTRRHQLLVNEMDFNAGEYLDGTPLEELGASLLELTTRTASGARTRGEEAGHSQVSIWRNWRQTGRESLVRLQQERRPDGRALPLTTEAASAGPVASCPEVELLPTPRGPAVEQVGMILPTSLCSGQIAALCAERLNGRESRWAISRFVALPHTEGCGVSGGLSEEMYVRTMVGYLTHRMVRYGLLLEHGCEKTHNSYFRNELERRGIDPAGFGWASVQLDGGLETVFKRMESWFESVSAGEPPAEPVSAGLGDLRVGLAGFGRPAGELVESLALCTLQVLVEGGTVVVAENASPASSPQFWKKLTGETPAQAGLAYGQTVEEEGLHLMENPSGNWLETLTGLGATGVDLILASHQMAAPQGHPMVPVVFLAAEGRTPPECLQDADLVLRGPAEGWVEAVLQLTADVASRRRVPKNLQWGNTEFQISRGLLGVSV